MMGWAMFLGGGVLALTPMYLNPLAGINGLTLLGIVLVVTGFTKLATDGRKNV